MRVLLVLLSSILMAASCVTPPEYSDIPEIAFDSINVAQATPGIDSIVVAFTFQDGDGDLGAAEGDTSINAYLVDRRTNFAYNYQIPFINERGNNKAISGTIWITVQSFSFSCRPNRPLFDTLSYEVYIIDRAGNESNRITTPDIVLNCQ